MTNIAQVRIYLESKFFNLGVHDARSAPGVTNDMMFASCADPLTPYARIPHACTSKTPARLHRSAGCLQPARPTAPPFACESSQPNTPTRQLRYLILNQPEPQSPHAQSATADPPEPQLSRAPIYPRPIRHARPIHPSPDPPTPDAADRATIPPPLSTHPSVSSLNPAEP